LVRIVARVADVVKGDPSRNRLDPTWSIVRVGEERKRAKQRLTAVAKGNTMDPIGGNVNDDKTMSAAEAASFIGYHVKTLERWRRTGGGPGWIRRGGRYFYLKSELNRWMAQGER